MCHVSDLSVTKHGYPPEFIITVVDDEFLLECLMCGVHHLFASGTSFDRVVEQTMVHTDMHLANSLVTGYER